ncbi:LPD7 domain-containing protein [Burkholderia orbicola]|uniref:LPD7 domain-containing protein n=1 Tax=Burkholderia orbicola TaxID=2978683 RepID=UPI002FDFDC77
MKDYLEKGQKSGRDFDRDELDERVILAGDLELTDAIINGIESEGERYKTITLSFKEDGIPQDTLRAIVEEFKEFAFAAYEDDEYNFYAEAHLPKIKSYTNQKTGEFIERKPHIHIVVPKINLLTGRYAEPFGYYERSEKYIAAFQEYINDKYGLASPQDNRRVTFTDASEMISRYKGDTFEGPHRELRSKILADMIERGVTTYGDFRALVSEYGAIKSRNAGTANEYLNVKPHGAAKGVNLKDSVFRRDFIELSRDAKTKFLTLEMHQRYEDAGSVRHTPEQCAALMREWRELRAREAKYINSGSSFYEQYRAMGRDQKIATLAEREARFYSKHRGHEHDRADRDAAAERAAAFERIGENLRAADRHIGAAGRAARNIDQAAGNVADRATIRAVATVVQRYSRDQAEGGRQAGHRGEFRQRRRAADNVVGQSAADLEERQRSGKVQQLSEFAQIKQQLEAGRLLAYLSKSHGVIPEKYEVTRGKDGSERIKCGGRNLNVSDFLTKEMHLSWKEAAPILRECYAAQHTNVPARVRQAPRSELWTDYQQWKREAVPQRRADGIAAIRDERRAALSAAAQRFNVERGRIEEKRGLTRGEKQRLIDIAKAERAHAQKLARDTAKAREDAERRAWQARGDELYKRYLAELAQDGGVLAEMALAELRKKQPDIADKEAAGELIRADRPHELQEVEPIARDFHYRVDRKGHVTYQIGGQDALKDEGQRVRILQSRDVDVIEEGLMLARAKFGERITLNGSDEFKRQAVAVAVEKGIRVQFTDPALQRLKSELEQARAERYRHAAAARQAIQAEQAEREMRRMKQAEEQAARAEAAKRAAEPPAPVVEVEAQQPAAPVVSAPENAQQGPAPTVADSRAADNPSGRYTGEILSHDEHFVYQQTAQGIVHHRRDQFNELPQPGDEVRISYRAGRVQSVKDMGREYGR